MQSHLEVILSQSVKRPRIADVARLAGVSEGTVSVVLNNRVGEHVRVSEETQQKIWDAVRQLGYVANPVAQSLAGGQTHIIAIFTFESIFPMDSRSFYYPFLIGIEEEAEIHGYDILLVTGSNGSGQKVIGSRRHIYQNGINRLRRADGAILLGYGDQQEVQQLIDEDYPFVFVGRRNSRHDNISYIAADYVAATIELVHYLRQNGHQRIAYLRSIRDTEASDDRERGVQMALEPTFASNTNWLWRGTPDQLTETLITDYQQRDFTAFIVEDDALGLRLLEVTDQLGLHCPVDFSLAVLGNPLNPLVEVPDWTSISIPRREMGREAFRMLLELLKRPVAERTTPMRKTLTCTFKTGQTVRRL
jgi:DNA-binding LacI/PurR family transcriptional regulator